MTSGSDGAEARATWARSAEALIGHLVGGKYRIESILGRGGMGTIYRAEQEPLGRKVALKVLHSTLGDGDGDGEFRKRFLLEAATLSQLSHPNIVVVHDYGSLENGEEAGACFMAMELLDGKTINHVLGEEGPFDAARALRITRDIARALRAAHDLGVIHRDLKPANVMLCRSAEGEQIKVLDFGLVKVLRDDSEELTTEGRFLGSPRYMSPEQIQRLPMDGRTDLYSLGVILFRMLANEVPFAGDHAVQTLMAHLQEPVPRIEERTGIVVPPPVEELMANLLAKDPADRFATASDLISAIDSLWPRLSSDTLPQSAELDLASFASYEGPSPVSYPSSSGVVPGAAQVAATAGAGDAPAPTPSRRWLVPALIGLAILLGIGGGVGVVLLATGPGPDPTPRAQPLPSPGTAPETPAETTPTETTPAETTPAETTPAAPVEPAARQFSLTITSEPPGATVERDGEALGETPLVVPDLDPDALDGSPARFEVRMAGHRTHSFEQGPADRDVTHRAVLERSPRGGRGNRRGGAGSATPGGSGSGGGSGADMSIKTSR